MKKVEIAWAAGLIDGEGCIHIKYTPARQVPGGRNPQHSLYLKVTMTHEPTIHKLYNLFGLGSIQAQKPGANHPGWNVAFSWLCCSKQAAEALRIVRPYLVTKSREADVAIEFSELPRSTGSSNVIPPDVVLARHDFYERLSRMKMTNKGRGIRPLDLESILPPANSK